jgi:hypothetical protein
MYALIGLNNKILDISSEAFEVHPDLRWLECPENCTTNWVFDGENFIEPTDPVKTLEEIKQEFNAGIQVYLDKVAKLKLYESSIHCTTYINSTNQLWAAEAQAYIAWRDAVWVMVYDLLSQYEQGEIELGTVADLINLLPEMVWPN